jgi:hypothetical protein
MAGQTKFGPVVGRRAFGAGWTRRWSGPGSRAHFNPGRSFRWELSRSLDRYAAHCPLPPSSALGGREGQQGWTSGTGRRNRQCLNPLSRPQSAESRYLVNLLLG